jgi:hypothetical protein
MQNLFAAEGSKDEEAMIDPQESPASVVFTRPRSAGKRDQALSTSFTPTKPRCLT